MQNFIKPIMLLLCLIAFQAKSETNIVQMMEGELRAGLTSPLGGYHTGKAQVDNKVLKPTNFYRQTMSYKIKQLRK